MGAGVPGTFNEIEKAKFCEILRNVWEIQGFGGSKNLLLNNERY